MGRPFSIETCRACNLPEARRSFSEAGLHAERITKIDNIIPHVPRAERPPPADNLHALRGYTKHDKRPALRSRLSTVALAKVDGEAGGVGMRV
jgi:hypothetical protein